MTSQEFATVLKAMTGIAPELIDALVARADQLTEQQRRDVVQELERGEQAAAVILEEGAKDITKAERSLRSEKRRDDEADSRASDLATLPSLDV